MNQVLFHIFFLKKNSEFSKNINKHCGKSSGHRRRGRAYVGPHIQEEDAAKPAKRSLARFLASYEQLSPALRT